MQFFLLLDLKKTGEKTELHTSSHTTQNECTRKLYCDQHATVFLLVGGAR
jgi:hypothetical protein